MSSGSAPRVYLDANILIYLIEGAAPYRERLGELMDALDAGWLRGVTSDLTFAEVMVKRRLSVAFFSTGDELASIGAPLAQTREPLHILVAAWHHQIGVLARHDFKHAPLEPLGVLRQPGRDIDGVEIEQRGLVGPVARRDQTQAGSPRGERGHNAAAGKSAAGQQ